jgi:hypothetical protein
MNNTKSLDVEIARYFGECPIVFKVDTSFEARLILRMPHVSAPNKYMGYAPPSTTPQYEENSTLHKANTAELCSLFPHFIDLITFTA